jgi:hypothetical protein
MILSVLIIRLALKINVLTHATKLSHVERVLSAKQHRIDLYVAAHQTGLVIHMTNVTSVGFTI